MNGGGWQEHLRRWLEAGALVVLAFVVSVTVWRVGRSVDGAAKEAIVAEGKLETALDKMPPLEKSLTDTSAAVRNQVNTLGASGTAAVNAAAAGTRETFASLNRKCKGPGGPDACGTLAEANKVMARVGDEMVTTQLVERGATPHVTAAMDAFKAAADGMKTDSDSLNKMLVNEATSRMVEAWAATSEHFEHMTGTADQLETHFAAPFLHPSRNPFKRIWGQTRPFVVAGAKVTASLF